MSIPTKKTTSFITLISLFVIVLGVAVIVGWIFDIEILKSIIPSYTTMKFNTALGMVLSGFALYLMVRGKTRVHSILSNIFALSVFVIGGLTLLEWLFDLDFGIDQLLVRDLDSIASNHPVLGRMSQLSATCFVLLSTSFFLIQRKNTTAKILGQILLDIIALLSFIAIMSYLYNVQTFNRLSFLTSTALHTAWSFLVLSTASSLKNPSLGIIGLFSGKKLGNKMAITLFSQLTIIILALTYIRLQSYRSQAITEDLGILIFALAFILTSLFLIWRTSQMLNRLEANKYETENNLLKVSSFLNATPDPIVIINENGLIQVVNDQTETVFGYTKEELINQPVEILLPERFQGGHMNHRKDFIKTPKARSMGSGMSLFAQKKDGSEIPVEISLNPVKVQHRVWVSAAIRDISERKKEEIQINRLASIIKTSGDAIISKSIDGTILTWNKAAEATFGYSTDEIVGQHISILFPLELKDEEVTLIGKIKKGETIENYETERIKKDGGRIKVSITLSPIQDREGNIIGASKILRDITEHHLLQDEIKKSREQFMTFFNMSPVASNIVTFHDGKIWYVNNAFYELLHYDESIIGKTGDEINIMNSKDLEEMKALLEKNNMRHKGFETRLNDKYGRPRNVIISVEKAEIVGKEYLISSILDMTERNAAEAKFKEISNRLKLATNNSLIGIWDYDLVNNTLIWDDIMFKVFGVEKDMFSADLDAWESVVHPDDIEQAKSEMQMAVRGEKEFDTEFRIIWPSDKSTHFIRAKGQVYYDDSGKPVRMLGTNWDVTAQKIAQQAIERSNQRNQIFIEQAPSAIAMFDKNMCYMAASKQWIEDYNITENEIIGKSHYQIFPEIGDDWKKIHQECLLGAINQCDEAYFEREDGSIQWITWDIRPWYITKGTIGGLIIYTADITNIKQKEVERGRIEEILDKTNEVARIGTWEVDLVANTVSWSRITKEIHEVPSDYEPNLTTAIDFFKPGENQEKIQTAVSQAIEKGIPYDIEVELITAKGNPMWTRAIGQAEFKEGKCIRLYGVFQDINKIKIAESTLNKANEELKAIFNTQSVSIIGTDLKGTITHFNKGAEQFLQYSAEEMIGKHTPAIIHIEDEIVKRGQELTAELGHEISGFDVFVEMAKKGHTEAREWTYKRKNGSTYSVLLSVTAITENDKIVGFLGVGADISRIKSIQKELANKNEELEQFAYVAAHDLQEPLRSISSFLSLLEKKYENQLDDQAKQFIQFSVDGALRMKRLINDILNYSRTEAINSEEVNLTTLVQQITDSFKNNKKHQDAQFKLHPLPTVKADLTTMTQLFTNLISNGLKYQPLGNNPVIEVDAEEDNDHWVFSISDNGLGIDPVYYQKVFAVFKRLHSNSEYSGTGIGLATCKKIVNKYGGEIWIEPNKDGGSIFKFTLKKQQ
ncbi:PAS domain S-box-containing protein [Roseivirga ehrenbergii]|nr:PAS domain S-box protein [Roseivirga ehrenbergii]TCL13648.1 PAS domain S-box-containing protein [Roseivirga ehrenbergii]